MFNIKFVSEYLLTPLLLSVVYIRANIKKENRTIQLFILIKGIFTVYLIIKTVIGYMSESPDNTYIIGLGIAIAIMDVANSVVEAYKVGKKG